MLLSQHGHETTIYDRNEQALDQIRAGEMPFFEDGGPELLRSLVGTSGFHISDDPGALRECDVLVFAIGTPIDEHLNPNLSAIHDAILELQPHLHDGQIIMLRSTLFPGVSEKTHRLLGSLNLSIGVSFCPERISQGNALRELQELPQIISAFDPGTLERSRSVLAPFTRSFIEMPPMEAELAKLMTNAWRYIQFSIVNQFFMIATSQGLDFDRILHGCRHDYPRMSGMPGAGFAAGPCLLKDTMQLAAFSQNQFVLGHAAMLVNEGLPMHMISLAKKEIDISSSTAGILGMAFKGESDDSRDSLSYKLKRLLNIEAQKVLCTDPYVRDPNLIPLQEVIEKSDVLFVATPHSAYRDLGIPEGKLVMDPWNWIAPASGT